MSHSEVVWKKETETKIQQRHRESAACLEKDSNLLFAVALLSQLDFLYDTSSWSPGYQVKCAEVKAPLVWDLANLIAFGMNM